MQLNLYMENVHIKHTMSEARYFHAPTTPTLSERDGKTFISHALTELHSLLAASLEKSSNEIWYEFKN